MRYTDIHNVTEGMSFHAYKKDPEKGYFRIVTGDQERTRSAPIKHECIRCF